MKQPIAHYVHCTAHALNLVIASVARSCSVISTALECVNELGVLVGQSGKLKAELCELSMNNEENKYCNERRNGLLAKSGQENTCLGIVIAVEIFLHLNINKALQERKQTVSGAVAVAETIKCAFKDLRREEKFDDTFERYNSYVEELDLELVKTQRIRKPPKKYSSEANCHVETVARKYFRNQFY
ncbi:hypothetical protein PR048_010142 [Dryococelus australis]|uniref:DUF4371 domain-containing protein n=1 Tax=Dryococelus australis TaxID=614101 RepID=A0ABQ9I3U4_9NEOP|nr:hypothetical protein PR048_010142 [Dryococelus australis]